jgi:hypothetical protein
MMATTGSKAECRRKVPLPFGVTGNGSGTSHDKQGT